MSMLHAFRLNRPARKWALAAAAGLLAAAAGSGPALAQGTVCYDLRLSVPEGGSVKAGKVIEWKIYVHASTGDNHGLALGIVDMEQATTNPKAIILNPGVAPTEMQDFNLPNGIANVGPAPGTSGYGGTPLPQLQPSGANKLVQIGGAQNNTGRVGITGFAQDVQVEENVGHEPGGRLLARGTFTAPNKVGIYKLFLSNPIANTFIDVQNPPAVSAVAPAAATLCDGAVSFRVVRQLCLADIDGNGIVGPGDLYRYVEIILSGSADGPIGASDDAVASAQGDPPPYDNRGLDFDGDATLTPADLLPYIEAYYRCLLSAEPIPLPPP